MTAATPSVVTDHPAPGARPGETIAVGPGYRWTVYGIDGTTVAACYLSGGLLRRDLSGWWTAGPLGERRPVTDRDVASAVGTAPDDWPVLAEQVPLLGAREASVTGLDLAEAERLATINGTGDRVDSRLAAGHPAEQLVDVGVDDEPPGEPGEPVEIVVVTRVADVAAERVRWLWPGRIPFAKVTVLDGDPGLGKSTFTLDLAARVTTASPLPTGERPDAPAAVVLLSAEDAIADTVRPRLEAAGADLAKVHVLESVLDPEGVPRPPSVPGDVAHIERLVIATGAVMVVIDPLMAYLGSRIDSHRDQDVRRAMHALSLMAERTGAAVVLVRHLNKTPGGSALYRGGGSIGIIGAARAGLIVAADPDDPERRVLASTKANLGKLADSLAYRLVNDELRSVARVVWDGASHHRADDLLVTHDTTSEDGADAASVLAVVLADGPVWVKQAIAAMAEAGFSKDQAKRAKQKIGATSAKQGKPGDTESGWVWVLPPRREHEGSEERTHSGPLPSLPSGNRPLPSLNGLRTESGR